MNLKNLLLFAITIIGYNYTIAQNLALNQPTMASSGSSAPAVDGNLGTRWESAATDTEWWYVDLGQIYDIGLVIINWETAYGSVYEIQVSDDASTWMTVYTENAGNGGIDNLPLSGSGRYVRYNGLDRGTIYGHSFWEFEVYEASDPMLDASLSNLTVNGVTVAGFSNTSKEQVILDWSTASEINAAYYSIERSTDATSWKVIGKVNAAGDSQQELHYKHSDDELELFRTGYYYRLKQVDFSGEFDYSPIVFVGFATKKSNFTTYPNPASNVLHVQGTDMVLANFSVYAITGQEVLNKVQITASENSMTIDLSQIAPGLYLLSDGVCKQLFVKK